MSQAWWQQFTASDIVTIIVSVIALVLSWGALRLSRKQVTLAEEQTALSRRQMEVMDEQRAKAAKLRVNLSDRRTEVQITEKWQSIECEVYIKNEGDAPANHVHWHLFVILIEGFDYDFKLAAGTGELKGKFVVQREGREGLIHEHFGFCERPIYPGQSVLCAEIVMTRDDLRAPGNLEVEWWLESDAGFFPNPGPGLVTLNLGDEPRA